MSRASLLVLLGLCIGFLAVEAQKPKLIKKGRILPPSQRPYNPKNEYTKKLVEWAKPQTRFGCASNANIDKDIEAAKKALLAGPTHQTDSDNIQPQWGSGVFRVYNCEQLWKVVSAANELTQATVSKGFGIWYVELSCSGNFTNCYNKTLSPYTGGNLVMGISGPAFLTLRAAFDCDFRVGERPIISGAAPASDPDPLNETMQQPFFAVGVGDDPEENEIFQTQLTMYNIIIDGGNRRPCISGTSAKRIYLYNVDFVNCVGFYEGAAIAAYDTPIWYHFGAVRNSKTYAMTALAPQPGNGTNFTGAGGAIAQNLYSWKGGISSIFKIDFINNWHENMYGVFYITSFVDALPLLITFSLGKFENNSAPLCAVGGTFRSDRFLDGTFLRAGRMTLNLRSVVFKDNLAPATFNGKEVNTQLCGTYQNPVEGTDPPQTLAFPYPTKVFVPKEIVPLDGVTGVQAVSPDNAYYEYIYTR